MKRNQKPLELDHALAHVPTFASHKAPSSDVTRRTLPPPFPATPPAISCCRTTCLTSTSLSSIVRSFHVLGPRTSIASLIKIDRAISQSNNPESSPPASIFPAASSRKRLSTAPVLSCATFYAPFWPCFSRPLEAYIFTARQGPPVLHSVTLSVRRTPIEELSRTGIYRRKLSIFEISASPFSGHPRRK